MYSEITHQIRVEVHPSYVPDQSDPRSNYYFFTYKIRITNEGDIPTQLISRHWVVTDGNGTTHEVKGLGVVGQQPLLSPGESFEYSSFCPLPTPTGNMRGTYFMVDDAKREYKVRIPLFFLRDLRNFH
jgi:ApaG protein